MSRPPSRPEERALREAADWSLLLGSPEAAESDRQQWQDWLQARPEHAQAWERIEAVSRKFSSVPAGIAASALRRPPVRRSSLRTLLPALLVPLLAVAAYGQAHNRSAQWLGQPGDRLTQQAPDGTRVTLNNAGTVALRYGWRERRLQMHTGEILVETARDTRLWARPFAVETPQGRIEPLGTRFTVRLDADSARITVLEGRVRLRPNQPGALAVELPAGSSGSFSGSAAQPPRAAGQGDAAWLEDRLVAHDQPFCDFVAELQRYRRERLACDPALQRRRISGVFALQDPPQALRAAAQSLDLRLQPLPDGGLWVSAPR
ncbi:MAG TPA: FecR domain-containing protein [Solimonas sp.]